jgi:hypothetical protein
VRLESIAEKFHNRLIKSGSLNFAASVEFSEAVGQLKGKKGKGLGWTESETLVVAKAADFISQEHMIGSGMKIAVDAKRISAEFL